MRFEELHLERFGHFDGLRLDLSGDDVLVHLVYGANEAGKSTALTAICDLLFGIPERTSYNFLHEYGRLRIGGTLANSAGQRLSFKRRKARVNSLLRPDESGELPDNSLAPYLSGISRDFFERMFGLNHERLRAGGQAMLDAGGEVARSLFEAGSGTIGVAALARALADDADAIGSPARKSASKPYWRAHDRYEKANERTRAEALKADAWNAAVKALDEATAQRRELDEKLAACRRDRNRLERVRRVVPLARRLDDLTAQLQVLADGPNLPEGFEESWRLAVQAEQAACENVRTQSNALERLRNDLEALGAPEAWPSMAKRIETLATGLGDYRAKRNDLPNRVRDLENGGKQMADLLRQLGAQIDPEHVANRRPSEPTVARVRSLIGEWNRLDAAVQTATDELKRTEDALRDVQSEIRVAGEPSDPAEAGAALEAALSLGDISGRLSKARLELQTAEQELADAMAVLDRCAVGADELARSALPTADLVVRFEQQFDKIATEQQAAEKDLDAFQAELRRVNGEFEALRAAGEVPTAEALRAARERRDHGWRLIRRQYVEGAPVAEEQLSELAPDGDVAGTFEASISTADHLADRREREAARVERFATLTGQQSRALEDIKACVDCIQQLDGRSKEGELKWAAIWANTGIAPGTPSEMRGWLARKDHAVVRLQTVKKAQLAVTGAELEDEQVRAHLLRAADSLGISDAAEIDSARLRDRVRTSFASAKEWWDRFSELRRSLVACKREREDRSRDLDEINGLLEAWKARWADEMPQLGMSPDATAVEAEAALSVWQKVGVLEADLAQTRRRRDQLDDAVRAYEAEVRAMLEDLGDAVADLDAEQDVSGLVPVLQRRLSEALQLSARIEEAKRNVSKAEQALEIAEASARRAAADLRSLRDLHGLPEDADVIQLAQKSARRRSLAAALEEERRALAAQGDGHDEQSLREEAAGIDADTAAAEVARLEAGIGRLQAELQTAAQAVTAADTDLRALREREGIREAAQEVNDAAAEMAAHAERWLRLRAAIIILNRAVERYRAANQHPLVRRASEIFGAVAGTGDNPIVRLSVDYTDEDRPVLVGFRRDDTLCSVAGMSDGTADQLYLALRIAAIERYIDGAEPMPFVADDLFITSDEERTVPGIKALAELGRRTQVLLFTHHRYVMDAAAQALGPEQLKVHFLSPVAAQRLQAVS